MTVKVVGLSAGYGGSPVVSHIDLTVADGEWLTLIGPNGAGKSTLLKAIAGLLGSTGSIEIGLADPTSRREWARAVAFVPQSPVLPPSLTVTEYVLLGRSPHIAYLGREGTVDMDVVDRSIEDLELTAFGRRHLHQLSGGEQQRVVLARALAQEPRILLLDEPTSALDIGHQLATLELIGSMRSGRGLTIISAMHDLTLAARFADRLALLAGGRVVAAGDPSVVVTTENIRRHYDADVRVVSVDDHLVVVPSRSLR
jgi:iron complex transport system ATP-binding protein